MNRREAREAVTGPFPSLWTPFNKDGSLDFVSLRKQIDFAVSAGAKTLLLTYGDSLMSILDEQEIADLTKECVRCARGRAKVVAADRQWNTAREIQFARQVREMGADALLVLPPDWAGSCTVESMTDHYLAVSKEIPIMVVTAAFSARGATGFGLQVLRRLVEQTDRLVAIKDDVCGLFAKKMGLEFHDRVPIFSGGQKQYHFEAAPFGSDGYLSTYISFKPEIAHRYWKAVQSKNEAEAVEVIRKYDMPFYDAVGGLPGGFHAGIYGSLELFGVGKRWRRAPYQSLGDEDMEKLAGFFRGLKLL